MKLFLSFFVVATALSACGAINITLEQCAGGFQLLGFDLGNFTRYPEFFTENSTMILAEAGTYTGADDIEEYVKFASPLSPYIMAQTRLPGDFTVKGFDPSTGTCSFLAFK